MTCTVTQLISLTGQYKLHQFHFFFKLRDVGKKKPCWVSAVGGRRPSDAASRCAITIFCYSDFSTICQRHWGDLSERMTQRDRNQETPCQRIPNQNKSITRDGQKGTASQTGAPNWCPDNEAPESPQSTTSNQLVHFLNYRHQEINTHLRIIAHLKNERETAGDSPSKKNPPTNDSFITFLRQRRGRRRKWLNSAQFSNFTAARRFCCSFHTKGGIHKD